MKTENKQLNTEMVIYDALTALKELRELEYTKYELAKIDVELRKVINTLERLF